MGQAEEASQDKGPYCRSLIETRMLEFQVGASEFNGTVYITFVFRDLKYGKG